VEQSSNVTERADATDSTSVVLAAESLAESACPQPRYQQLVEAEVVEAMPGMFMGIGCARTGPARPASAATKKRGNKGDSS